MVVLRRLTPERRVQLVAALAVVAVLLIGTLGVLVTLTFIRQSSQIKNVSALTRSNAALTRANTALSYRVANQEHASTQQNLSARYADCLANDGLRAALYDQALASKRTTPLLFQLVPILDTPEVRRLAEDSRKQRLKVYLPRGKVGCAARALSAVPAGARGSYHVP